MPVTRVNIANYQLLSTVSFHSAHDFIISFFFRKAKPSLPSYFWLLPYSSLGSSQPRFTTKPWSTFCLLHFLLSIQPFTSSSKSLYLGIIQSSMPGLHIFPPVVLKLLRVRTKAFVFLTSFSSYSYWSQIENHTSSWAISSTTLTFSTTVCTRCCI